MNKRKTVDVRLNNIELQFEYNEKKKQYEYRLSKDLVFIIHCLTKKEGFAEPQNDEFGNMYYRLLFKNKQVFVKGVKDGVSIFCFNFHAVDFYELCQEELSEKEKVECLRQLKEIFQDTEFEYKYSSLPFFVSRNIEEVFKKELEVLSRGQEDGNTKTEKIVVTLDSETERRLIESITNRVVFEIRNCFLK